MKVILFVFDLFMPIKAFYSQNTRLTVMNSCMDRIEEIFAQKELSDDGSSSLNNDDLEIAKKDIEDVINNLKLQGFKINYSFENKENGCKITIDID